MAHPLLAVATQAAIEAVASGHRGRRWVCTGFTDLSDRASHPCGILHGKPFSVFAKLSSSSAGQDQFSAELLGLTLIARLSAVRTPAPIAEGLVELEAGALLLLEALPERAAGRRTREDWLAIGATLAALHQVRGERFGLAEFDGFFGPFAQSNRQVPTGRWADFYAERRVEPMLRAAVDSGNLPPDLAAGVGQLLGRLPELCGDDPHPCLLHGDSQQNNFLCLPDGAAVIDPAPYFGHPELDLALIDYFEPVPDTVFDGYRQVSPIDPAFGTRRELWRIFAYLAVIAVDGQNPFGRTFIPKLATATRQYL